MEGMLMTDAGHGHVSHTIIRGLILTGFAFLIVRLDRSGSLGLYVASRTALYVKLSALGLYAASLFQFYSAIARQPDCGCGCDSLSSPAKQTLVYMLFLLPLALGFLLPD
jgi:putative membrane protein